MLAREKISFGLLIIILLSVSFYLSAQAPNDDMENSLFLHHDQPHQSQTNGCTVQWNCVDETLTGKCIDYHNDQWFDFNSETQSTWYINISQQACRDLKGVQLVVLKGKPCDPSTYEILTCVSLANQDDIYVKLNALELNQQYFINIDGYLHDFCAFEIEVSQHAKGLPLDRTLDLNTTSSRKDHMIRIEWEMPDSLKNLITGFQVFRKIDPAFKVEYADEVPLVSNAYGDVQTSYFYEDSIAANKTYYYKLTAEQSDGKLLLINNYKFHYSYTPKQAKFIRSVRIPLENVKHKESITVIIYDQEVHKIIRSEVFTYHKKEPKYIDYKTHKAIQASIDNLLVKVINNTTKVTREYLYDLWDD